MHGNTGVRIVRMTASWVFAAFSMLVVGCGSHVVVADEAKHSDASQTGTGGADSEGADSEGVDAGDATHITLCGKARCKDISVVIPGSGTVTGYACCPVAGESLCGVVEVTQCVQLNFPGHADPSCHSPFSGTGFDDNGCCRPDGTCGVLDTQFGLGCAQLPFVPASIAGSCVY
jgi:hypothetical protein